MNVISEKAVGRKQTAKEELFQPVLVAPKKISSDLDVGAELTGTVIKRGIQDFGYNIYIATDKRGIHIIFSLFLHENICCGYSLEVPQQGTSNEYPQHMFLWRNKKDISIFRVKKVPYLLLCINIQTV